MSGRMVRQAGENSPFLLCFSQKVLMMSLKKASKQEKQQHFEEVISLGAYFLGKKYLIKS